VLLMTPNIQVVQNYIETLPEYAYVDRIGVFNCRKIAGSQSYSQHSWANALDIHFTSAVSIPAQGDALAAGTRMKAKILAEFGEDIYEMLWQVTGHWEHIHVSTWPKGWLTPPCAGGKQRIKNRDGSTAVADFPLTIEGDDGMSSAAQKTLVDLAFALFPEDVQGNKQVWLDMPEDDPQWWQYFNPAVVRGCNRLRQTLASAGGGGVTLATVKAEINKAKVVAS
jgi:hypothetical protein